MKKIVVLDGHTLNPGDLSWDGLRALGDCTIHDRTPPDQVFPRAAGHEIVLTNKVALAAEHFDRLPELEYVGVLATGTNVIDLKAAGEHGVVVTNVPDYGTASVAQLTFALLLELALGVGAHSAGVRSGKWSASRDFSYTEFPLVELAGLTLGILGFGRIGRQVAAIGRALGMEILIHTRTTPAPPQPGIRVADLDTLFREADAVTLHCPLTEATQGLVNAVRLASMKPSAFLINTSRGPLVDEAALATALNAGSLAGAAVDVLALEPPPATNPLLGARNCIVTPHIGWATAAARRRLLEVAVAGVRAFLDGRPQHVVVPG
jgi:glycerate dehydrogenase